MARALKSEGACRSCFTLHFFRALAPCRKEGFLACFIKAGPNACNILERLIVILLHTTCETWCTHLATCFTILDGVMVLVQILAILLHRSMRHLTPCNRVAVSKTKLQGVSFNYGICCGNTEPHNTIQRCYNIRSYHTRDNKIKAGVRFAKILSLITKRIGLH